MGHEYNEKSVFCSYIIHPAWCNCVVLLVHSAISGRDIHPIERKKKKTGLIRLDDIIVI
jgi:hypothetical protein